MPSTTIQLLDGREIPWLSWGNGTGNMKKDPVKTGKIALDEGIRHIDTAQGYEREEETGQAVNAAGVDRNKVWVTSKLSQEGGATNKDPVKVEDIRAAVEATTKKLGSIPDLFLIHNPFVPPKGELLAAWKQLEVLKDEGKLKSLGVSNFRPQDLDLILQNAKHKPVVNQIEYHPYVLAHLEPVLKIQKEHGIVTESYGPLSPLLRHPNGGPLKPVLERIAKAVSGRGGTKIDAAGVLLLWCRDTGAVAVTGSGNPDNIKSMAALQNVDSLTKDEIEEINSVGKTIHFRAYAEHMETDFPVPNLPSE